MIEVFTRPQFYTCHVEQKWLDIPYAHQSDAQKLDIYLPATGGGPFPVIAMLHGGGWMYGDKGDIQIWPFLEALQRNYAVVFINYRLSDEAQFPCQIYDCKAAIRYLRANARRFELDKEHVGVWGIAAGGHLAALLGTSAKVKGLEDFSIRNSNNRTSSDVQAVVSWYGPIGNFLTMDKELAQSGMGAPIHSGPDSAESRLLGRTITDVPAFVNFASPMTYIKADSPPFLIQHGLKDDTVPVEQSINFAAELEQKAGPDKAALEIFPEAGHADPLFETPQNLERVLNFFDKHLK